MAEELPDYNRRELLKYAGISGSAFLAGCNDSAQEGTDGTADGGGGTQDGSGGADEGGTPIESEFHSWTYTPPNDLNFNLFTQGGSVTPGRHSQIIWSVLGIFNWELNEIMPVLAKDWSVDGKTLTIDINNNFTWHHNGEPVTAQDVVTRFELGVYMADTWGQFTESFKAVDDTTVEVELRSSMNSMLILLELLDETQVFTPSDSVYGEKLEELKNASSDDERNNLKKDLVELKRGEPFGNGPYQFDRTGGNSIFYTPYDGFPVADVQEQWGEIVDFDFSGWPDTIDIPSIKVEQTTYTGISQGVLSNKFDGGEIGAIAEKAMTQIPNTIKLFPGPAAYFPFAWQYQFDHKWLGKRKVRQALSYLQPMSRGAFHPFKEANQYNTGMVDVIAKQWLSDDLYDNLIDYGQESKKEEAKKALEAAGFSKQDGTWMTPDGGPLELTILFSTAFPWIPTEARHYVNILREFGIDVTMNSSAHSTFVQKRDAGEYDITWNVATGGPLPYQPFNSHLRGEAASAMNFPETVEVPPVGELDSDETISVDIDKQISKLEEDLSEEEKKKTVSKLAWVWNVETPILQIGASPFWYFIDSAAWNFPDTEDPIVKGFSGTHPWVPMYAGLLQPKRE